MSRLDYLKLSVCASALACIMAGPALAAPLGILDVSGVAVDGGSATVVTLSDVQEGTLESIFFDIGVQHNGFSFGRETGINIIAPGGESFFFFGGFDFGFGLTGAFSFEGGFDRGPVMTGGDWTFRFSDSFNDSPNPDYVFLNGSSITLVGTPSAVPLPAGIVLGLSGLAGLGALGLRRRRRDAAA